MKRVGIIAFQGAVQRHADALRALGVQPLEVRTPAALAEVERLVIPGGESTTIGMLMERAGLIAAVRRRMQEGMPVFGTCAGMILLADKLVPGTPAQHPTVQGGAGRHHASRTPYIGGLAIELERNAYGRQIESFEAELEAPELENGSVPAVFIRAPVVRSTAPAVQVLAEFEGAPVLVRQDRILAASFHPELTEATAVHRYFIDRV